MSLATQINALFSYNGEYRAAVLDKADKSKVKSNHRTRVTYFFYVFLFGRGRKQEISTYFIMAYLLSLWFIYCLIP